MEQMSTKGPIPSYKSKNIKILVPIKITREVIKNIFQDVANKLEFCIIDKGENFLTAVHYNNFSLQKLLCCFNGILGDEEMTGVKLIIQTEEQKEQRLINVKCLSGVNFL